jgi:hypothetical protein
MLRKSLILGSITLLMVMLFAFTGCEGPVGPAGPAGDPGENGDPGKSGDHGTPAGLFYSGPDVSDEDLVAAFAEGDVVVLGSDVKTVYGEIPAGKTLEVLGTGTKVLPGYTLAVNDGTLNISGEAILEASAVYNPVLDPADAGALTASGSAKIIGGGAIVLPYVLGGEFTAGLHFNSPELKTASSPFRYPGSVFQNDHLQLLPAYIAEAPVALTADRLPDIFSVEANELTVYNLKNLADGNIPLTKKLILKGSDNTLSGDFSLGGGATLVVAKGASLDGSNSSITVKEAAKIFNEGTIKLFQNGRISLVSVSGGSGSGGDGSVFENNGRITFSPANNDSDWIKNVVGLWGTGTIIMTPQNNIGLPRIAIRQNVVIEGIYTISFTETGDGPFNGVEPGKIITIGKEASISLHPDHRSVGATLVNNGTLITPTVNPAVVSYIWGEMKERGNIKATGPLDKIAEDFVIPEGIVLTLTSTSAKLTSLEPVLSPFDIIVKGILAFDEAAVSLAPSGDVIVENSGSLKLGTGFLAPVGNVVIKGFLDTGTAAGLKVGQGKTLEIEDSAKIGGVTGNTGPIVVTTFENAKIDGVSGFSTHETNGVRGVDFQKSLAGILGAAGKLVSDIDLPPAGPKSPYNTLADTVVSVIGTVEVIDSSTPQFVSRSPNAVNDSSQGIIVDANTTVLTGGQGNLFDKGYLMRSSTATLASNPNDFVLCVDSNDLLAIQDTGSSGSLPGYGVVSFNRIRFENEGLIGPVQEEFRVGVKTKR